jgi:HEAT repeat protein
MAMYPHGSSMITGALEQLEESARQFFAACGGLTVSQVDGELLIDGVAPGAEALAGGVADFAGVLQESGVKSCIFSGESAVGEMSEFLQLVARASDPMPVDEWHALLAEKNITHIRVEDELYHGAGAVVGGTAEVTAGGATPEGAPEPAPEPVEEPVATNAIDRAEQIAAYPPDKLLAPAVVSSVPGILKALLRNRKSDLLQRVIGGFTSILSAEADELHGSATKALVGIYQQSAMPVQEVLLTLSRDPVIVAIASEKSPEACANLLHFGGQIARRCVEQGDFDSLDRTVTAMGERAKEENEGSEIQKAAEQALTSLFGSAAFRTLLLKLESPSFEASTQVIGTLAMFEDMAVPILVGLIREAESPDTRRSAAQALREIGPEAVKTLTGELTRYASPELACRILGVLGDVGADIGQAVRESIMHPDKRVRAESVQALRGLDRGAAMDVLIGLAGGADPEGAGFVIGALGELGYPESVDWLGGLLKEPGDPLTQTAACAALGKIADAKAVAVLANVAVATHIFGLSMIFPDEVRAAAADALGRIGGEEAAKVLERLVKDRDTTVRRAAGSDLNN